MGARTIPRIVVAATASGAGKTTATVALIAAMAARGLKVAPFKCGPDYLDPSYHRRAAHAASHNLDGWMMGREAVRATFTRAAAGCDLAVIEGMMGLFDSATPADDEGSTAEIARWLGAPVILVTDAAGVARTIAAVAAGFRRFDQTINVAGLICNRVGSRGHLDLLRQVRAEVPIIGGFPAAPELAFPERHLGLLEAGEAAVPERLIDGWRALANQWLDLDAILALARSAPPIAPSPSAARPSRESIRCRIGIARDEAFHFYYEDNLARLESLGAEAIEFSPVRDARLPAVDGLYFGGGYPEAHAAALSQNAPMIAAVRDFAARGGVIYAECGGLMYLTDAISTLEGETWPMAALLPGVAVMSERLQALGYAEVATRADSIIGPAGATFRGHQFRHSTLEPARGAGRADCVYEVRPRWGGAPFAEGYRAGNVLASYVHAHWASNPAIAEHLVRACAARS